MFKTKKFSIICDADGKILSFDNKCEAFFKFSKKSVIGVERIYNFISADFSLYFIDRFNSFKNGSFSTLEIDVVLSNSISASIILRKKINKKFIIVDFFDSSIFLNKPKKSFLNSVNLIFRSKFTLGSIIPLFFSFFLSIEDFDNCSLTISIILFFALYFFHASANTFNDYFDWISGRDKLNVDYVLFSTGGSRAIDLKIISERNTLYIAIFNTFVVFLLGVILIFFRGFFILYLGLIGFFCVYFYSAPPIHLASRYGLGELMHIICLGPLMTYGCSYALTGVSNFNYFVIGFPFGLLITCCLLLNEIPDSKFDKLSKKFNLVVVLGVNRTKYLFFLLLLLSFIVIFLYSYFFNYLFFILVVFILPYLYSGFKYIFNLEESVNSLTHACIFSFYVYLYVGLILILALILNSLFLFYPW